MNKNQMSRLQQSCLEKGPLCVGLDTDTSYLPPEVLKQFDSPCDAVLAYNTALIDACEPYAACFKVQIAYYEAMGLKGLEVYSKTLKLLHQKNIPVISDVKRGDIADTAAAYARAHFSGDFETDIITVNPYMGFDTLVPFTNFCHAKNTEQAQKTGVSEKGMFVLLRTSNPGMTDIEKQPLAQGGIVLDHVGKELLRLADTFAKEYPQEGSYPCSPIGAVVGCTEESDARTLRDAYPNIFFLIPGYGAQGGAARIAATLLDKAGGTVNSSRGILTAWKKAESLKDKRESNKLTLQDIVESAAAAAKAAKEDLLKAKSSL